MFRTFISNFIFHFRAEFFKSYSYLCIAVVRNKLEKKLVSDTVVIFLKNPVYHLFNFIYIYIYIRKDYSG